MITKYVERFSKSQFILLSVTLMRSHRIFHGITNIKSPHLWLYSGSRHWHRKDLWQFYKKSKYPFCLKTGNSAIVYLMRLDVSRLAALTQRFVSKTKIWNRQICHLHSQQETTWSGIHHYILFASFGNSIQASLFSTKNMPFKSNKMNLYVM